MGDILYGDQPSVPPDQLDDPASHEHRWQLWRKAPGSPVVGSYCRGCDTLVTD